MGGVGVVGSGKGVSVGGICVGLAALDVDVGGLGEVVACGEATARGEAGGIGVAVAVGEALGVVPDCLAGRGVADGTGVGAGVQAALIRSSKPINRAPRMCLSRIELPLPLYGGELPIRSVALCDRNNAIVVSRTIGSMALRALDVSSGYRVGDRGPTLLRHIPEWAKASPDGMVAALS